MNTLPPVGSPERDFVVARLMTDTGFFCRFVLGMDTDRDEHGNCLGEIGKGGIRPEGPHQQVIQFLDDDTVTHKEIWAPRAAYKSSMMRGHIMRLICAHPNISILLFMHEYEIATDRCREIREELENNPILRELFPNMVGHLWKDHKFITGHRHDTASDTPTLYVGSPRKLPIGSRPNKIFWDDIVVEHELGDKALERGRRCVERSLALGARGCTYTYIGTPKHYADAAHWIADLPGWKKLIHLDVGYDIQINQDKSMSLVGEKTWPHLDRPRLEALLKGGMQFATFMSEYKLKVVSGTFESFNRKHFHPIGWHEGMHDLTGYLLTDIAQGTPQGATSEGRGHGALNVLLYVGVDERDRVYMLDCEVGRWQMLEFCERYMNMVMRWSNKVNHRAEVWEQVSSNTAYSSFVAIKFKERGRTPRIIWQKRNNTVAGKDDRIRGSSVRFQAGEVYVVNSMPRTWVSETDVRPLWDPEGYHDTATGARYPAGDLVEQFVRFPYHALKDIPDAFSLVDAVDKETGQRVCFHVRPSRLRVAEAETRRPLQPVDKRMGASQRFYARSRRSR